MSLTVATILAAVLFVRLGWGTVSHRNTKYSDAWQVKLWEPWEGRPVEVRELELWEIPDDHNATIAPRGALIAPDARNYGGLSVLGSGDPSVG